MINFYTFIQINLKIYFKYQLNLTQMTNISNFMV